MREPDVVAPGVLCSRVSERKDSTRRRHLGTDRGQVGPHSKAGGRIVERNLPFASANLEAALFSRFVLGLPEKWLFWRSEDVMPK